MSGLVCFPFMPALASTEPTTDIDPVPQRPVTMPHSTSHSPAPADDICKLNIITLHICTTCLLWKIAKCNIECMGSSGRAQRDNQTMQHLHLNWAKIRLYFVLETISILRPPTSAPLFPPTAPPPQSGSNHSNYTQIETS